MLAMDHVEAPLLSTLNLPHGANIVVAGAYKGDTVAFLTQHYPDAIIVAYEPQTWAMAHIPDSPHIAKMPYALATYNGTSEIHSFGTDAASMCVAMDDTDNTRRRSNVSTIDAAAALMEYRDNPLSLMVLNVEGYEYTLIPYLLDIGIKPVRLLVQYHHYNTREVVPFIEIRERLRRTYLAEREVGKGWFYYA